MFTHKLYLSMNYLVSTYYNRIKYQAISHLPNFDIVVFDYLWNDDERGFK